MRRHLPTLWIGLFCLLPIAASEAEPQQRRYAGPPHFRAFQDYKRTGSKTRVVLRNGLTVLIEEHASFPLASIATCVQNDSRDERRLAASELLARLYRRSLERSGEAYKLGGAFSFSSRPGDSCYCLTLPNSSVLAGLETQARLLHRPKIDAAEAQSALQEWRNESSAARATRLDEAAAQLRAGPLRAFVPHPRPDALSASDDLPALLGSVHQAGHRPEKAVLVIAGSVFEERLLKKVVELYAPLRGSGTPTRAAAPTMPSPPQGPNWKQVRQGEAGHLVLAAFPTPGRRHKDHLPLQLVPYLLATGRSSMLGRYGITPQGGILDADAWMESDEGSGVLSIAVYPDPAHLDTAEVQALAQLEVLSRREPDDLEIARAKALWLRARYEGLQSLEQRSRLLALHELAGSYLDRDKLAAKIDEVTPADIRRVVREYLKSERLSLLEYAPKNAEQRSFTGQSFAETMHALVEPAAEKQIGEMNALAPREADAPAAKAAFFEFKPSFTRTDMERTSVLRGPEIYLQERHDVPLVHFGFFFPGGRRDEKSSAAGITELMMASLLRGGGSGDPLPWQALESTGAQLEVVNETDFFGFQATVLSPYREIFLGMMVDWMHQATFSEESVDLERRRLLGRLERQRAEPQSDLSWARRQLFAGDPFGESRYGSPESLASLTPESLNAWKQKHIDGLHPWILVRGDFDGTSFVQPFISKLSSGRLKTVRLEQHSQGSEEGYLDEDEEEPSRPGGDSVSSAREGFVLAGFQGPPRGSRDEWVLDAVENLLHGVGGRLERLLQEEPAADATRWKMAHEAALSGGAIFVMGRTDPSSQEKALEQLTGQLARLQSAVIRPADWNNARVLTITEFYRRQQAGGPFTLEMARNIAAGAGVRFEQSYLNTIRQARPNDLQLLAGTYLAGGEDSEK